MKSTCGRVGCLRMTMMCEQAPEDSAGTETENSLWKRRWVMLKVCDLFFSLSLSLQVIFLSLGVSLCFSSLLVAKLISSHNEIRDINFSIYHWFLSMIYGINFYLFIYLFRIPQRLESASLTVCTWCMPAWNRWRLRFFFLTGMIHQMSSKYRNWYVLCRSMQASKFSLASCTPFSRIKKPPFASFIVISHSCCLFSRTESNPIQNTLPATYYNSLQSKWL